MTNTRAGKYRHRITITNPSTSRDSAGGRVGTGSTVATVWADRQDWSGTESREDGKETAVTTTKFFIRYRDNILPKMQVAHGSENFDIESVLDFDGRKRELTLFCRRVVV